MNTRTAENEHVLAVIQGAAYGGAHNQVARLQSRLAERGFDLSVVLTDEPGNAAGRLRREGVPLQLERLRRIRAAKPLATAAYFLTFGAQVQRLRRHIRFTGAAIVQVHGITNVDVAVAGRLERVAVVWQVLDTRAPAILRRLLAPLVVRIADALLVTGRSILDVYPGLHVARTRTYSYFPPVEDRSDEEIASARRRGRAALGLQEDEIAIGCLANLNPQKGHDRLIAAFADSRAGATRSARLFVRGAPSAGHDRYRRLLDDLALQNGLPTDTVDSLDGLSPSDFIAALDVFSLSAVGRSEGTPTVIIEAMQAGVPVVVTAAGGVVDLVDDNVQGIVVPVDHSGALAAALDRVALDEPLRRRMGAAARQRAQSELSIAECEESYVRAYTAAMNSRRKRNFGRRS